MTSSLKSAGDGTSSGNLVQTGSESNTAPLAGVGVSTSHLASRRRRPPRLVVKRLNLSFKTETVTSRGRWVSQDNFDVPLEDHREGYLRGLAAAGELLHALEARGPNGLNLETIIKAACDALDCPREGRSRRPAAYAFIRVLSHMVVFAARHADHGPHVAASLASARADHTFMDTYAARLRSEFLARMKAGKLAKKDTAQLLARLQGTGHA